MTERKRMTRAEVKELQASAESFHVADLAGVAQAAATAAAVAGRDFEIPMSMATVATAATFAAIVPGLLAELDALMAEAEQAVS